MPRNFQKHKRRSIRLQGYDYSQAGMYFVTICVQNKECLLGHVKNGEMVLNKFGKIVDDIWKSLPKKFQNIECNEYIIMPNHFHGVLVITNQTKFVGAGLPRQEIIGPKIKGAGTAPLHLGKIIAYFKYESTKQINVIRNMSGIRFWQRNYYEHVIRNENDHFAISQYILDNPIKWEMDEYYP